MASRTASAGQFAAGTSVVAQFNNLPGGWIGYVEIAATTNLPNTEGSVAGLSVTTTVGPSRRLRIMMYTHIQSTVAGDYTKLRIKQDGTTINDVNTEIPSTSAAFLASTTAIITPTSGSHTYNVTGERLSGTGQTAIFADSARPTFLLVEDLGPAS